MVSLLSKYSSVMVSLLLKYCSAMVSLLSKYCLNKKRLKYKCFFSVSFANFLRRIVFFNTYEKLLSNITTTFLGE